MGTFIILLLKLLQNLDTKVFDTHFEMVLEAIKKRDYDTLDMFYTYYKLTETHPLRVVIERLLAPLEEQVTDYPILVLDNANDIPNSTDG